jgi:hypothetical protein
MREKGIVVVESKGEIQTGEDIQECRKVWASVMRERRLTHSMLHYRFESWFIIL